ncbi:MAG: hypothetical protein QFF03_20510 [Pseudomonadota bacterium]|nr:hypothetical protein [Pseudomonadota bacterium]
MSRKKHVKTGKRVPPAPAADVKPDAAAPLVPAEQNVESDAPAVGRRSLEADDQDNVGDIERAGV